MAQSAIDRARSFRVADIAVFDVLATAVVGQLISSRLNIGFMYVFLILIIVAIFVHKALGVNTMLNYYLGVSDKPERDKLSSEL